MALLDWIKKTKRTVDTRPELAPGFAGASATTTTSDVELNYDNLGEVARGGMGAIMRVVDKTLLRTSAMKVLEPADGQKDDTRRAIFFEEAQITAQLDHPNICPVYAYGRDKAGTDYMTMKLVRGRTLADVVHDRGYDPSDLRCLREALEVFLKVCDALAFAHSKGVLHRDLKPENIMVGDFGQVYLMDWGVAKVMTSTATTNDSVRVSRDGPSATDAPGAIVGTLMYMAPEQARGESGSLDVRSDVFGLGAILYEIITQIPPYFAQNLGELVLMAQGCSWRPPQQVCGEDLPLPAALCAVCEKALQARPEDRFQDVMSLKAAVEEFLVGGLSFPTMNFQLGQSIITEGEAGDSAFIIQRGYCRVYKFVAGEMRALADLGPGDVFGETAVFADAPRMATVQAISEVTVQVVTKDVFTKDLGVASSMGSFVKALATRFVGVDRELRAAQDQLRALSELHAQLQQQQQALLHAQTQAPPAPASAQPHSGPLSAAAVAVPLPPPPGQVHQPPPQAEVAPAPAAPAPAAAAAEPAPTSPPSTDGASLWASLPEPPPALVAAMARLYGMQVPPEEAARLIVAAAVEAATRLKA